MGMANQRRLVDSRGSFCPGPITDLFKAFRASSVGDEIELLATDPAAEPDVKAWAAKSGNQVVEVTRQDGHLRILVRIVKKGR